jgi:peptide/nickel transport system permease protein
MFKNKEGAMYIMWNEIRNDKLALIGLFLFIAIVLTVYIFGYFVIDETQAMRLSIMTTNRPPSDRFILGTDDLGRCMLRQLILAARNSLNIAFVVTIGGASIGIFLGLVQGYFAGYTDLIMGRLFSFWGMIPGMMLIILIRSVVSFKTWWGFSGMVILVSGWLTMSGLIRIMALQQARLDYVSASKTLGTPDIIIMLREVLPNLVSIITSGLTLVLAGNIGLELGLTFLGFGLPPGVPSLGQHIAYARSAATLQFRPWQWLPAMLLMFILMLCINFVGQALNRAADARKRTM